jgi:hypothetical protein
MFQTTRLVISYNNYMLKLESGITFCLCDKVANI